MSNKIKVMICRAGAKAELAEIENSLQSMEKTVGGLIDPVLLDTNNILLICNEEALIRKLPKNIAFGYTDRQGLLERKEHKGMITSIVHGDCLFCSLDSEQQPCSLSNEQIELLKNSIYIYKESKDEERK